MLCLIDIGAVRYEARAGEALRYHRNDAKMPWDADLTANRGLWARLGADQRGHKNVSILRQKVLNGLLRPIGDCCVRIRSFFSGSKPRQVPQVILASEAPTPAESGGKLLRSFQSDVSELAPDAAKELLVNVFALSVVSFEESFAQALSSSQAAEFREAFIVRTLIGNLIDRNYIGFLAVHALIYVNRLRGWAWSPSTKEEVAHVGEMASLFLVHPHYQLTPEQLATEQMLLAAPNRHTSHEDIIAIIKSGQWEAARIVCCSGMSTLSRNLMEVWAGAEAHEQRVYQTLMLSSALITVLVRYCFTNGLWRITSEVGIGDPLRMSSLPLLKTRPDR